MPVDMPYGVRFLFTIGSYRYNIFPDNKDRRIDVDDISIRRECVG